MSEEQSTDPPNSEIRLIIAGSRDLQRYGIIEEAVAFSGIQIQNIKEVIEGDAIGIDRMAGNWAKLKNIKLRKMPADWSKGNGAGYARNVEMANVGTHLLAVWNGFNKGTGHMIDIAFKKGYVGNRITVYQPHEVRGVVHVPMEVAKQSGLPVLIPEVASFLLMDQKPSDEFELYKGERTTDLSKFTSCYMHGTIENRFRTDIIAWASGHVFDTDVQECYVRVFKEGKPMAEKCYLVRGTYESYPGHVEMLVSSMGDSFKLPPNHRRRLFKWLEKKKSEA